LHGFEIERFHRKHPFKIDIIDIGIDTLSQWIAGRYLWFSTSQQQEADMPLVRVSLRRGKPATYRKAIFDGIYDAMRATFDVPEEDRFMVVSEHDGTDLTYSASYLGIARTDDFVLIQITVSNTRPREKKQALYRAIADNLAKKPGIRREDVFINLVEVLPENWSFGNGVAQYVKD
jgi:4-oxalocrotonate tautomerase